MNKDEILWEQEIGSPATWKDFITYAFLFLFLIYTYEISGISITDLPSLFARLNGQALFFILLPILGLLYYVFIHGSFVQIAHTMLYQISADAILFNWKQNDSYKLVEIPFTDITAINLVSYHSHNHSTIYISTKSNYPLLRYDFERGESRSSYTFEKIDNGAEVYDLLCKLWKANQKDDKQKTLELSSLKKSSLLLKQIKYASRHR